LRRAELAVVLAVAIGCSERSSDAPPEPTPRVEPPIELWLGGDVHVAEDRANRLYPLWPQIGGAVGIVNLEGPIADDAATGDGLRLHNDPAAVVALDQTGVRVVGIANNHALDSGEEGPRRTAEAARSAGFIPAGLEAGVALVEAGGGRVVAITAHDLSLGPIADLEGQLARARASADVLVATFHVTGPPSYLPRPELRAAVDAAIEIGGALVVAAHGSHAVGPVERRGDAVIAWGLGNLLFSCDCTSEIDGAILRVSIDGSRVGARIVPIDAGLEGAAARPSHDPELMLDLLEALGSTRLTRWQGTAFF